MLYKYNLSDKTLVPLQEVSFHSVNILERQDIEVWFKKYPEITGEDLLVISSEYNEFDKTNERPDVLAIDRNGKVVVIELKSNGAAKSIELQAIKYAAYCSTLRYDDIIKMRMDFLHKHGALSNEDEVRAEVDQFIENSEFDGIDEKPRVILVATDFRPEVTATVLWLLTFGMDITCIKLTPYQVSEEEIGISITKLIPIPEAEEYQIRVAQKDNAASGATIGQRRYIEFWAQCKQRLESELDISIPAPPTRSWYTVPLEIPGVHLEWFFVRRSQFGVEVHFESTNKERNVRNLELLLPSLTEFADYIDIPIFIERDWGRTRSRIGFRIDRVAMDEEHVEFAVVNMVKLYNLITDFLSRNPNEMT